MKNNVAVFGASGFLGNAIVKQLISTLDIHNKHIFTPTSKELNLTDQDAVKSFLSNFGISTIFHCAGKVGGIIYNVDKQYQQLYDNIPIITNVIQAAQKAYVPNFHFMASSCVYPPADYKNLNETDLLKGPPESTNEGYALAKIVGIKMCEYISSQSKKNIDWNYKSYNICNLYGPHDNFNLDGHFLSTLIAKIALSKKLELTSPIKLLGDGSPVREMMYVDDAAWVITQLSKLEHKEKFTTINIGSGHTYSIKEIAEITANIMQWNYGFEFSGELNGAQRKVTDRTKMNKILKVDSSHFISLYDGLYPTIEYFDNKMNTYSTNKNDFVNWALSLKLISKQEARSYYGISPTVVFGFDLNSH